MFLTKEYTPAVQIICGNEKTMSIFTTNIFMTCPYAERL